MQLEELYLPIGVPDLENEKKHQQMSKTLIFVKNIFYRKNPFFTLPGGPQDLQDRSGTSRSITRTSRRSSRTYFRRVLGGFLEVLGPNTVLF